MQHPFDLSPKVSVVTGGNGGIGLAIAHALGAAGSKVALWGRNPEKNRAAYDALAKQGVDALELVCDVSDESAVVDATRRTVEHFGRVDVCVANAGFGAAGDPLKMSLDDWRRPLETDLDGVFLTFREAAKHMVERGGGGKLIGISSISEVFGTPMQPHYAAGKAGVSALVRSLAVRLGRHDIQVNSIQPGWIVTDATRPAVEHERMSDAVVRRTPARRWGRPDEIAGACVYLASDASSFHTGDTLRIDGGYTVF